MRDFVNISSELRDLAAAPLEEQDRLADLLSEEKISQKMAAEKIRESTKKLNELVYILNTHHKGLLVKMSRNSKAPTESTSLNLSKNKKISQQLG